MKNPQYQSPLARGWCAGIAPDQNEPFDNQSGHEAVMSTPSNTEYAKLYQVCTKTIFRWIQSGVAVADPLAVARHLTSIKNPSPAALRAVNRILAVELYHLTN